MNVDQEWAALTRQIRHGTDPGARQRATGRLWQLAVDACRAKLASFDDLPADEHDAIVSDFFHEKLPEITGADHPRAFVVGAVGRRAIDRFRKQRVRSAAVAPLAAAAAWAQDGAGGEDERLRALDRQRALAALPARDRDIILAVFFFGEDRDDVARIFRTGRDNVDQIIARFRKRHGDDAPPSDVRKGRPGASREETP